MKDSHPSEGLVEEAWKASNLEKVALKDASKGVLLVFLRLFRYFGWPRGVTRGLATGVTMRVAMGWPWGWPRGGVR